LGRGGSITLLNGTERSQQDLLLTVISLSPVFPYAYFGLGDALPKGGSVCLLDGTHMSRQELLLKFIDLEPAHSSAYYSLLLDMGQENQ
jgi:hypothetical protein